MTTIKNNTKIKAATFKAQCLKIMDQVNLSNYEVTITKHGKEVAKLVSANKKDNKSLFGALQSSVKINQDVIESIGENWDSNF